MIFQILLDLQRQKQHELGANYLGKQKSKNIPLGLWKHGLKANGEKNNMSKKRHREESEDT